MKFYDREKELNILQMNWKQTSERGRLTVLIGRRRIGKTTLLTKNSKDGEQPFLYLYVSKDNERVLAEKFQEAAEQALGLQIFGRMESFVQFFERNHPGAIDCFYHPNILAYQALSSIIINHRR